MSVFSIRTRTGLALACLAVLLIAGCSGAESRKAKHLEKGRAFLAAGNFDKARVEFRNALQIAPTDSEARFENGVVDEKLANPREAAQFYQGAIDTNADNIAARAALGRLYLFGGAPDKSLETIKPSLDKHPDDASLLTVRAAASVQLKNLDGALHDAERAVQLAPDNEDAISVLAGIYKRQDQPAKAQALLTDAIKRIPGTVDLRLTLAQLYASMGKESEVEGLLVDLVRIQPKEKSHRLRLAQFYARNNHVDEAEHVLREGVKALPDDREMKTELVEFLAVRRGREFAEKELDYLIAANPKDYALRFVQGQFYEQGKELAKAEAVYQKVIAAAELDDPGLTARNRLAALRIQAKDVPSAEKLIAQVLAKSPRDNDALILRGNLALAKNDPRAAIADLRSVLRDQPNAVGVMRALARAHLANGEPALAEETIRRAVETNPKDSGARLDLAQLLTELGKPDQAKPIIEELVKQEPNDLQALDTQFKIAFATKDLVTAESAADALVATQPKSSLGYYYQGKVAQAQNRPLDALRLYTTAADLQPETLEPLQAATQVLVELKRTPEALKRLDDAIARYPQNPMAANIKGEVLLSTRQAADAEAAFKMAIERAPKWAIPYRNLAIAQLADHDSNAAIATLQLGIDKSDGAEALQTELATLDERLGKPDDAMQVYEAALRRNPASDLASNNLAMLLVTYRKDPASLERAKELSARFVSSNNPSFLDTYGWVLYKRGDAAAAVSVLQTVLTKASESPVSLYHLGMAEALAGQPDAARDNLARSLQSGKNFTGIEEAKATLEKLAKGATSIAAPSKS